MTDVDSSKRIIMWTIIFVYIIMDLTIVHSDSYRNYKAFEVIPHTVEDIVPLFLLEKNIPGVSFQKISEEIKTSQTVTKKDLIDAKINILVPPNKLDEFYEALQRIGATYELIIIDMQDIIDMIEMTDSSQPRASRPTAFDFNTFHTLQNIYENLDALATQYPDKVQIVVGGQTYQGRLIKGVKVSFEANNPGVFIQGGISGNEWISTATVMFILHQLLTSNDTDVRKLAEKHDWYIFPLFNPDGYEYTHTTDRLWKKTLKPYNNNLCVGVNLDRNWDCNWIAEHGNGTFCTQIYPGREPFSEIEAKSMSEYIKTISDKFYAYISFRSFGQHLLFPYNVVQKNFMDYVKTIVIAKSATTSLKKRYGTNYKIARITNVTHYVTGCVVNYIQKTYGKHLVFEYLLRGHGYYGFMLPPEQIIPTGEETLDSLVGLFKTAKKYGYTKVHTDL